MRDPAAAAGHSGELRRRLGVTDAVVIGLGAMIGAGIFAALAPAARAAGSGLLIRGYLAGWGFVVGKAASCAAMALAVGSYVWPGQTHTVAVAAVVALTAVDYAGVRKSAWLTRVIVAVVLAVLAAVVVAALTSDASDPARLDVGGDATLLGVLQAAGLLFFAFAGARFAVPHRAELAVGAVVVTLTATVDLRGAIGFSSFGVLAYYAIANASAWTLTPDEGRPARIIPVLGLAGCLALAFTLPLSSVVAGAAVLATGAAWYGVRRRLAASARREP
ncbi:integral membrane protein MviN [Streptomyces sp. NBRC 110611]|uniref:hypothetical protein n=1 Tax=Streptomyces sp. NBRC 110611 TaxID=1621259 RepID=UPI0008363332|nr:hypothetical protein [Streptomyces sp. NBRC 110611]GAU66512.1 integral membrane protein MviN [Streptomyces sp. NBRC 110611]